MRQDIREDAVVNSLVGEGAMFRGDLAMNGLLRIDGDFAGSVKTTGKVFVGKNGRADCSIQAVTVVIGGMVKGAVVATEKVVMLASAVVLGSVRAPRVIVEEGVLLDGYVAVDGSKTPRASVAAARPKSGLFAFRKNLRMDDAARTTEARPAERRG